MISPKIWEDPGFNKLEIGARLLFIGMFSNADDYGYLRADRGSLRRLVFGFDNDGNLQMDQWIGQVNSMKNVHFFDADDETYAHFVKWDEYQKQQDDRKQTSEYPKCSVCKAVDK